MYGWYRNISLTDPIQLETVINLNNFYGVVLNGYNYEYVADMEDKLDFEGEVRLTLEHCDDGDFKCRICGRTMYIVYDDNLEVVYMVYAIRPRDPR